MNRLLRYSVLSLFALIALTSWGQSQSIKVISYNIWNGFEKDSLRRQRFVDWIQDQQADVVVLTELVGFKADDLRHLGESCQYSFSAIAKEEGYPVGVLSKKTIKVVSRLLDGFWHGMMHVHTYGIDVIAAHFSPFEWNYRLKEAHRVMDYIREKKLTTYLIAGDLNAHSPFDADELATHDSLLIQMRHWDANQPVYRNLRDGYYDFSVLSAFLSVGLDDTIGRLVHPASARMSFPSAFLYGWRTDDKRLPLRRERLDYILLSPRLMPHCTHAAVYPVEGVSDHYPVSVTLTEK